MTIDAVDVIDPRGTRSLGPLPAGGKVRIRVRSGDGALSVAFTRGGDPATYELDSYYYAIPGNAPRRLTIGPDGVVRSQGGGSYAKPEVLSPTTVPAER
jgi:hypothetical protein